MRFLLFGFFLLVASTVSAANFTGLLFCKKASCEFCEAMKPAVTQARREGVRISTVDIHTQLGIKLGIKSTPTTVVVKDGEVIKEVVGQLSVNQIKKLSKLIQ